LAVNLLDTKHAYRALFKHHIDVDLIANSRLSLNKGLALGSERFKSAIEKLSGRKVIEGKRGRPLGWRKKKTNAL
jgi:putative transposase|tara:strand:- start:26 stop:250 length:225 start_codon:yes stop_codon:yes gene_type:complete